MNQNSDQIAMHKYHKYKKKYIELKRIKNGYYLLHGTDLPHLEKILKSGYIYSGRYLPDDETRLGGWEKLPYVYCSIYFDDIKNLPYSFGYSLILDPKIIREHGLIFNKGWRVHPSDDSIIIKPNDPEHDKKIGKIKDAIMNPSTPAIIPPLMRHEVLIKDKIDIHKYLIGLIVPGADDATLKTIMGNNKYQNIKLFTTSDLPNANDLLSA